MDIAKAKRRENIAEYILYLWQLEDLLRALQFSPEAIFSTLIAPRKDIAEEQKHIFLLWYLDLANLLQQEGKEEKGHLEHTLHLIQDLHDLHLQLMKLPVGEHYRHTFARLEPELPRLRAVIGNPGMSDTELCFGPSTPPCSTASRVKATNPPSTDTLEFISPVIAELADLYGKVERVKSTSSKTTPRHNRGGVERGTIREEAVTREGRSQEGPGRGQGEAKPEEGAQSRRRTQPRRNIRKSGTVRPFRFFVCRGDVDRQVCPSVIRDPAP